MNQYHSSWSIRLGSFCFRSLCLESEQKTGKIIWLRRPNSRLSVFFFWVGLHIFAHVEKFDFGAGMTRTLSEREYDGDRSERTVTFPCTFALSLPVLCRFC